jgi:hypothetical protein
MQPCTACSAGLMSLAGGPGRACHMQIRKLASNSFVMQPADGIPQRPPGHGNHVMVSDSWFRFLTALSIKSNTCCRVCSVHGHGRCVQAGHATHCCSTVCGYMLARKAGMDAKGTGMHAGDDVGSHSPCYMCLAAFVSSMTVAEWSPAPMTTC